MSGPLILSLFSGAGLLDEPFRELGACVVSAGDLCWGKGYALTRFHPPAGVFAGVIGGPPCQMFSPLAHLVRANGHEPHFGNLIPEFERVVSEAQPRWYLMENVPQAPIPMVGGYLESQYLLNNRWVTAEPGSWLGAEQQRLRRFSWGYYFNLSWYKRQRPLLFDVALFEAPLSTQAQLGSTDPVPVKIGGSGKLKRTVALKADPRPTRREARALTQGTGFPHPRANAHAHRKQPLADHARQSPATVRYSIEDACELQGLPRDWMADAPYTAQGKLRLIANGVPLALGRAVAKAVWRAMGYE